MRVPDSNSDAERSRPLKNSRKRSRSASSTSAESCRSRTLTLSSGLKVYARTPPKAAAYWSCLPTARPSRATPISQAASRPEEGDLDLAARFGGLRRVRLLSGGQLESLDRASRVGAGRAQAGPR